MPKPPTRAQIERLAILLPEERQRLLAIYKQEQAELNDKEEREENAKTQQARKGSISGNALNGLTAEQRSEKLLGLGGKRTKHKPSKHKTYRKRYSRRSRHAR